MKNVEDIYALTPLQQLMLLHAAPSQAGQRGEDVLLEQFSCTLVGPFDAARFREAWRLVAQRHPALRTAFAWEGLKAPVQAVRRDVQIPWREIEAPPGESDFEERWTELASEERASGVDPRKAPLFKMLLLRGPRQEHRFLWTCHHLIFDGWCLPLILKEAFANYAALADGRPAPLPPARPFRDYVAWLAKQNESDSLAYWRAALAGAPPAPPLAIDRTPEEIAAATLVRGASQDLLETRRVSEGQKETRRVSEGAPRTDTLYHQHEQLLPVAVTRALQDLVSKQKLTLGAVLEAAWAILLSRYAETNDLVIGVTVSGRPPELPGVETIVGPFANTLPLRLVIDPQETALSLFACARAAHVELAAHEHTPLPTIQSAVGAAGRLFESVVVLENYPLGAGGRQIAGLSIRDVHGDVATNYPLTLIAIPGEDLALRLRYDSRRFAANDARNMLGHLATLLSAIAENPKRRVGELSLVSAGEAALIFDRFSRSPVVLADIESAEFSAPLGACAEVQVLDAHGQPAPIGLPGELCLRKRDGDEGLQRTGQAARWLSDGRIEALGPADAAHRAGRYRLDAAPAQVLLDRHPLVEEAFVAAASDAAGSKRLAAYIVPVKESATLLDSQHHAFLLDRLRSDLAAQLPVYARPWVFAAVTTIPRLPSGEVDVAGLPPLARPRPQGAGDYVAPRDLLEAQLAMLWQDVLGVAAVGVTDDFHDLGGVSVQAVSLAARVEERFGRKLPLVSVFQQATIAGVAELLRREPASAEESCLAPIRPMKEGVDNKTPLFCVHPAGGTVFCYLELARHLPTDQPLYGLQAQGIDGAAAPHETVEEMAAHYIQAMRLVQPTGPYMVCGWSSGGILAFEVARQLAEAGERTKLLALFDAGVADPDKPFEESDLAPMLKMLFPDEDQERAAALENLPADEQLAYFRERAELAQLVVAGADASQASYIFEVFRKNVQAIASYKPSLYSGKITLFRAQAHATPMHRDEFLGWGRWAAEVQAIETPGDHVTMFREPTIRVVAEKLAAVLSAVG